MKKLQSDIKLERNSIDSELKKQQGITNEFFEEIKSLKGEISENNTSEIIQELGKEIEKLENEIKSLKDLLQKEREHSRSSVHRLLKNSVERISSNTNNNNNPSQSNNNNDLSNNNNNNNDQINNEDEDEESIALREDFQKRHKIDSKKLKKEISIKKSDLLRMYSLFFQ